MLSRSWAVLMTVYPCAMASCSDSLLICWMKPLLLFASGVEFRVLIPAKELVSGVLADTPPPRQGGDGCCVCVLGS